MNKPIVFQAALALSIALFFGFLYLAFLGSSPLFSLRSNLMDEELNKRVEQTATLFTKLEQKSKGFLDANDLSHFFAPAPTPATPSKKKSVRGKSPSPKPSAPRTTSLVLPEDVKFFMATDPNGNLVYSGEKGRRVPYVKNLRGFSLDNEAKLLYLILPYTRNRQFLGNIYFAFDYPSLLRQAQSLSGSTLRLRDVGLSEAGMAVFNYSRESLEKGFSVPLDDKSRQLREGKSQITLAGSKKTLIFSSIQPFTIKVGLLYEADLLGLPLPTLLLLLLSLLATGLLFLINYRELSTRADQKQPVPDLTPESPKDQTPKERPELAKDLQEDMKPEVSEPPIPNLDLDSETPLSLRNKTRADFTPVPETETDDPGESPEVVEIPEALFHRKGPRVDPQIRVLIDDVEGHEVKTVSKNKPVIPKKSPSPRPAVKKVKKTYPAKMSFLEMASGIQSEESLFHTQRNILKNLDKKFPGLAQCKMLVLVHNHDEGFIPFQWRDFDPRTRNLFRIPKKNHLVEKYLDAGKVVHIGKKLAKSRQLRSWISEEDLLTIQEIAFIPIQKRKKIRFICVIAHVGPPTL